MADRSATWTMTQSASPWACCTEYHSPPSIFQQDEWTAVCWWYWRGTPPFSPRATCQDTPPLSCSAAENLLRSRRTARTPIPSLQYTCTGGRCWGNDRPKWRTLAFAVFRGRERNSRTMAHHVYSYSQSASCLSGGSLPDPWGERQWAAGDSRDKGDAWSQRQGGKGREKVRGVPSLNTHYV